MALDSNRPVVRVKGFGKKVPTTDPPSPAPDVSAPVAPNSTNDSNARVVARAETFVAKPEYSALPPKPETLLSQDLPQSKIENQPSHIESPRTETLNHQNLRENSRGETLHAPPSKPKTYRPDEDAERVRRRQWWKYNLFVKSGRNATGH
jgi:hypothetical protein